MGVGVVSKVFPPQNLCQGSRMNYWYVGEQGWNLIIDSSVDIGLCEMSTVAKIIPFSSSDFVLLRAWEF